MAIKSPISSILVVPKESLCDKRGQWKIKMVRGGTNHFWYLKYFAHSQVLLTKGCACSFVNGNHLFVEITNPA